MASLNETEKKVKNWLNTKNEDLSTFFAEKLQKTDKKTHFSLKIERHALKVQNIGECEHERRNDETYRGNDDNKNVAAPWRDNIRKG